MHADEVLNLGGNHLGKEFYLEEKAMEKGFNDDELADIMNEIESLEQEFTQEVVQKSDPIAEEMAAAAAEQQEQEPTESVEEPVMEQVEVEQPEKPQEVVAQQEVIQPEVTMVKEDHPESNAEMQEVLTDLAEKPAEEVVATHEPHDDNVHHMEPAPVMNHTHRKHHHSGHAKSAMSFNVEGDMQLDLSFHISGKHVHLNIGEHGLELEFEGGMKFSIPLEDSEKKAA